MPAATTPGSLRIEEREGQILARIEQGINISEAELRYQLDRKDRHPLSDDPALLDVLAALEAHGLIVSALQFTLTERGRAELRANRGASS